MILFGTEDTRNIVNDDNPGGYENIEEFIPIGQPHAGTLAKLQSLRPSTVIGDRESTNILSFLECNQYDDEF